MFFKEGGRVVWRGLNYFQPLIFNSPNWRDLEGEWSTTILDQMNYQIYAYYINKITNEKTNYSSPPYLILKTSK